MSAIDVATLKEHAEEFFAKAVAGEATLIEQNGKRAVLVPCDEGQPDFDLYPQLNALVQKRLREPAKEATGEDWEALRKFARSR
jgi:hypothetical protein